MKPDTKNYNPDPSYLRALIESAGYSQRGAAKQIGVSERTMRSYVSPNDPTKAPYPVQYCLENLSDK